MSFVHQYQPAAIAVAGAAYTGGLGDWQRFILQFQQHQADQSQQAAQYQQSAALQNQGQLLNAQQNAAQIGATNQWHQANIANQAQQSDLDRQFQGDKLDQQQTMMREQNDMLGNRQSEDDRRKFVMDRYDKGDWKLDARGNTRIAEIRSAISAVQTDKTLTPQERTFKAADLNAEYWDILNNPPPPKPGDKQPTPQEELDSTRIEKQLPDGSVEVWSRKPPRNGQPGVLDYSHTIRPSGLDQKIEADHVKAEAANEVKIQTAIASAATKLAGQLDPDGNPISEESFNRQMDMIEKRIRGQAAATQQQGQGVPPPLAAAGPPQISDDLMRRDNQGRQVDRAGQPVEDTLADALMRKDLQGRQVDSTGRPIQNIMQQLQQPVPTTPVGGPSKAPTQQQYDPSIDPGINLPPRAKFGYLKDSVDFTKTPMQAPVAMKSLAAVAPTLDLQHLRALVAHAEQSDAPPEVVHFLQRELAVRPDATPTDVRRVEESKLSKATSLTDLRAGDLALAKNNIPQISTAAEWKVLERGTKYIADGKVWTKQ